MEEAALDLQKWRNESCGFSRAFSIGGQHETSKRCKSKGNVWKQQADHSGWSIRQTSELNEWEID